MNGSPSSVQWMMRVLSPPARSLRSRMPARGGVIAVAGTRLKCSGSDCGQKAHLKLQRLVSSMLTSLGRYGSERLRRNFQW